jgi:hypothetical protein
MSSASEQWTAPLELDEPATDPAPGPAPSAEKRPHRRPAASVPSITGLRFKPHGIDATLVDISETGLLAECAERLKPGTTVTILFEGTFEVRSVAGRVVRSFVSSMGADCRLRYQVGVAFNEPIALDDGVTPVEPENTDTNTNTTVAVAPRVVRNRW